MIHLISLPNQHRQSSEHHAPTHSAPMICPVRRRQSRAAALDLAMQRWFDRLDGDELHRALQSRPPRRRRT
jgi:hypothetical protein